MLKKSVLLLSALAASVAAHAQEATTLDATAISGQLSTGVDTGMGIAVKIVGVLVSLMVVGIVIGLIKKGNRAAK